MCCLERCLGQDAKETDASAGKDERVLQEAGRALPPPVGSSQGCGSLAFLSHKLSYPEDSALPLLAQCSAYNVYSSLGLCSTEGGWQVRIPFWDPFWLATPTCQDPGMSFCALPSSDHPLPRDVMFPHLSLCSLSTSGSQLRALPTSIHVWRHFCLLRQGKFLASSG